MNVFGTSKNGTRVEVNGDFSILIPYGCIYTTETEEDSQIVFKLSKPKEAPASYREGVFALGDEGEEQNWVLELKRIETDKEKLETQLAELDIKKQLSTSLMDASENINKEIEGIASLFGGESKGKIGVHSLIDRPDLKCGYGLLQTMGKLLIMAIIGTPRNMYVSGKMTADMQAEIFLNKLFRSIHLLEDVIDGEAREDRDSLQDDELFVAVRPPKIIGNDVAPCNGTPIVGLRFFLPVAIHQEMINDGNKVADVSVFQKGDSFSIDVIEQPIHCNLIKTEEGDITLDLFIRSELGHFGNPDLGMTVYADGRETEIRNKGRIGGDASMTLAVFLKAAQKLRTAITEQGLVEKYRNSDPDKEGMLVAKKGDQFSFTYVSGRKRPSMSCTTLLNGIQMGRPYEDETKEALLRELMPKEGLEELAESGDEAAMNDLANAYLNGDGVEQNFEKSLYWWKKLAELDDPTGQYNVGLYYAKGCGVERDFEKAAEWMRKSADNGDEDAEKLIDLFAKAGENLRKAEAGDADAQAEVAGLMMYLGRSVTVPGIDPDNEFKEAVKWAKKAADNGSGEGCWILGLAYEHGRSVEKDLGTAIKYFEKGVSLGHAKCMGNLGAIYMDGKVKGKTKEDGFRLMKKAAELGDVHSMKNVGSCYQFGNGVEDSMRKAIYWYEKYLEHEEDAELEMKVRLFKTIPALMEDESEEGEEDKTDINEEENERNRLIKSFITILKKESIRRSEEARQRKEAANRFRDGIFVIGVPKEGKRVVVNNDFSVFIPYGCYYRTMVLGTDNVVLKVGRQERIPEEYTDGTFKLYVGEKDANWFIDISTLNDITVENDVENGISDFDIKEYLDGFLERIKEKLGSALNKEPNNNPNIILDEKHIKCAYTNIPISDTNQIVITFIITTHKLYSSYANCAFKSGEINELLRVILGSLEPLHVGESIEKAAAAFIKPSYTNNNSVKTSGFSIPIPDHMIAFNADSDEWYGKPEEELYKKYLFVAVNEDFEGGTLLYRDAPMGMYIEKPRASKDLDGLWNRGVDEVSKMLIRNVLNVVSGIKEEDITRVKTQNEVTAVFGVAGEEKSEPSWRSYIMLAASRKALLVGMVYFNCAYVDRSVTDVVMKEWLEKFEVDENSDLETDTSPVFDRHLTFDLPEKYVIERGTDDDGDLTFQIFYDPRIDEEGKKKSKYNFTIFRSELDKDTVVESNIDCNFKTVVRGAVNNIGFNSINFLAITGVAGVAFDDCVYMVNCVTVVVEKNKIERAEELAKKLMTVVNSMVIDGTRVSMSRIPISLILDEDVYSEFRKTDPSEKQHTHIDFLRNTKGMLGLFGASVNQNGTEYAFDAISEENLDPSAIDILNKYTVQAFDLSGVAFKMSEIFRVDYNVFDQRHDREQEIRNGLIHKAVFFEAFRSFAWTLSAYCKDNKKTPGDVKYETLCKMCRFIDSRNSLNYSDQDFSPAICACDDIHIYYLPQMSSDDYKKICEIVKKDGIKAGANIVALEELRRELEYLYPAISTIYKHLLKERNYMEELEGNVADILYVWCSMTYAARRAVFSEDGPMNCFFDHPNDKDQIPEEVRTLIAEFKEKEKAQKTAEKIKKSQQSQVRQLIAESRKEYRKHTDQWKQKLKTMTKEISSKRYTYEYEADGDIREVTRERNYFGWKLEKLIKDFDEKAGKIIKDEDDYVSLERINEFLRKIFEDTPNINLVFNAYGAKSGTLGEENYKFSIDSKCIYRKWQNKLHNTSQYKKEQEEKKRAEEERRKAEAERRKKEMEERRIREEKEMEERRIREEKERKRREEEQKKAEEERKRAEEEARKKAIAVKYYNAIKDERTGSRESLESAIAAYKELGDYEESVAHIESCKQKLDEVIRLEKEEEARRLEEEAQKKARMKKLGIRIGIAAVIIAALLLIAKLTQAYLEEKARKDAYNNAVTLMEDGKYDEAIEGFKALEGYEDSEAMITEAENRKAYAAAEELLAAGKLEEAKKAFEKLGDFSDSKKRVEEIIEQQNANAYAAAEKLLAEGKYDEAIKKFQELGNYSDSAKRVEEAKTAKNESLYKQAAEYAEKEEYSKALAIFTDLGSYKDSAAKAEEMQELYNEQEYEAAEELMDEGNYQAAQTKFEKLGDYADASDRAQEAKEAAEEKKEQEELRKNWSDPQYISSKAGGFYVFTFEWSDGATQPEVYFEDGAGKHHLTITSFSKNKMELYDSRGVNHTLTRRSDGSMYWRWESSTLWFE